MNFVNHAPELAPADLAPLPDIDNAAPLNQVDGIYETPRKSRKRKHTPTPAPETSIKRSCESQGSRDYRPRSQKGSTGTDDHPRRTSARLAQRQLISADNIKYVDAALSPSPVKPTSARKLEIQDSTADEDDFASLPPAPLIPLNPSSHPITPQKRMNVVPSSQTPASISPDRRHQILNGDSQVRSPLRERSINVPPLLAAVSDESDLLPKNDIEEYVPTSSRLSMKPPAKRKARVEDSQANVYSLPQTSSPPKQPSQQVGAAAAHEGLDDIVIPDASYEIPSTSQIIEDNLNNPVINDDRDDTTTLPLPTSEINLLAARNGVQPYSDRNSQIVVRDFAEGRESGGSNEEESTENTGEQELRRTEIIGGEVGDSDSDFGSPIKNDTQYNFELQHRTSSPSRSPSQSQQPLPHLGKSEHAPVSNPAAVSASRSIQISLENLSRPIPTPRLVASSPVPSIPYADEDSQLQLPELPRPSTLVTEVSTTRVPLNDTAPSSSPSVPTNKAVTQRSVHPASMPHPSQVSTQEATQAILEHSSLRPLDAPPHTSQSTQRITIKDSSSMRVSLEEIPLYQGSQLHPFKSQAQNSGRDLTKETEEDEYDLDPPSMTGPGAKQPNRATDMLAFPQTRERSSDLMPPPQTKILTAGADGKQADVPSSSAESTTSAIPGGTPTASPVEEVDQEQESQAQPTEPPAETPELTPLPGFDNDTQSDFTQDGHVTAAFVRRQWDTGELPRWYTPKPYQVPGFTRRT
jgi:hypothetical protein